MPHITIEFTANLADHHDIDGLVAAVHDAALAHGLPRLDALRTRAGERVHYRVADGAPGNAFVAIHVRLGPGRDTEDKQTFMGAVLEAAQGALADGPLDIAWSIELSEIDPEFRINRNDVRSAMAADREHGRSAMAAGRRDAASAMAAGREHGTSAIEADREPPAAIEADTKGAN